MKKIGFIGTGVMGRHMVRNLMKHGYAVSLYTRTKRKAEELLAEGAEWKETISELAREADVVITIVGFPEDVEEVYFKEDGILNNASGGTVFIDMTTSSPELAVKIAEAAQRNGQAALDAPVSGSDVFAEAGKLTIMAGGEPSSFEKVRPVLEAMGENVVLQGPPGAGQHTKMSNQIAIASTMMGVVEAITYAEKAGLDPAVVMSSIEHGAAGSFSLSKLGKKMIGNDFEPGFYVKHFVKDMGIALASAERMELPVPGLRLAKEMYEELMENGGENEGTQALYKYYKWKAEGNV
ncbi:NAD(P)-dependent oxidoreductase [Salimicrobium album]|uniref:3-hydroxyisobutyrate dehydrogenase n=1 Tax=Salimicrobium album TaxID=50717 RepID=A0A1H3FD67_9BACI|nr:NAD(P)-dependent oxidoreductase [Salimicrobium album]SDX88124.1 3-hydroxyisobutyrate dehydrogenase [Salimicrobium album]